VKLVDSEGDGWLLPRFGPPPWPVILRGDVWQVTDESDVHWMLPRLRPTPFRHFTDPVAIEQNRTDDLDRTYIRCCSRPPAPFDAAAAHVRSTRGWRYVEIETPHVPYVTHPHVVTEILEEVAASR